MVLESQGTPKAYSVEVTHGVLGDDEPLTVCRPCEEMIIIIDNIHWAFYWVSGSIVGFCILYLTVSSQQLPKAGLWVGRQKLKLESYWEMYSSKSIRLTLSKKRNYN